MDFSHSYLRSSVGIDDDLNELTVQEHGCMLLAEIVTSEGVTSKDILDCAGIVATVGRLQIQEK